jgi:hypothetical protein
VIVSTNDVALATTEILDEEVRVADRVPAASLSAYASSSHVPQIWHR